MSGCAFSISSSSSTAYGCWRMRVDEQAALLEADVSGRRADQPGHRVLLHVLAHVVADELVAEMKRELLGELGLADAGRAGEQEAAGRPIGLAEAGARALDRAGDRAAPPPPARTRRGPATPRGSSAGPCRTRTPAWPECAPCARRLLPCAPAPISAGSAAGLSLRVGFRRRCAAPDLQPHLRARPRRSGRWRCRAACSRAGAAPRAWPPPRAHSSV